MSGRLVAAIDDDALVGREAVHLDEQLIQRLLALFVAERVAAAAAADGVELVDEDDARRMAARVLEQLADARGADAGVHLDEVRAAREQERHLGFAGNRSRQQRLAGARRADQQHALRNAAADRREPAGLAQEVDDLLHLFLRLVDAGDVGEGHGRRLRSRPRASCSRAPGCGPTVTRYIMNPSAPMKPSAEQQRDVAVRRLLRQRLHVDAHVLLRQVGDERRVGGHVAGRRRRAERLAVRRA